MKQREYHISRIDVTMSHWPNGAWSVYRITGDEIADRIVHKSVNEVPRQRASPESPSWTFLRA